MARTFQGPPVMEPEEEPDYDFDMGAFPVSQSTNNPLGDGLALYHILITVAESLQDHPLINQ